ncbi:MAG: hydroxymethylglutaryl-CoA lyase [Alphaproteobacteria bacterium]|jgi:hydroxymethylglutaryl-CoA lyase
MSEFVKIIEVGPRDGLQNEVHQISAAEKVELIRNLKKAGVKHIEAGAFVSPKSIPQMADTTYVMEGLDMIKYGLKLSVLVPNIKGYENAVAAGAKEVAIFASASESFSQKNVNCSIAESFERFAEIFERAKVEHIKVRAYISCIAACPYEGAVAPEKVVVMANKLIEMGAYEISLGDTTGVANPAAIKRLIFELSATIPMHKIAVHFHDTYGQALANIYAALEVGVRTIDCSVAGLGGCPYAPGSSGNVATEDVVFMLDNLGYSTGIDLEMLVRTAWYVSDLFDREPVSKVARAMGR